MGVIVVAGIVNPRPQAPLQLSPVSGAFEDMSGIIPVSFTWQYNPGQAGSGLTQLNWIFDTLVNGGATQQFWDATHGVWSNSPFLNTTTPAYGTLTHTGNQWTYTFPTPGKITAISVVGTTVTFTAANAMVTGQSVTITGVSGYTSNNPNGTFTVLASGLSSAHFSVTVASAPSGGAYTGYGGTFATSFTDGNVYQWAIASQDTNGLGVPSGYSLVTAQQIPVVGVSLPTGTIANAAPLIVWSTVFAPGATQVSYRVCIYTAAQYGIGGFTPGTSPSTFDTGVVGGNASSLDLSAVYQFLPTGVTYRAYVQVVETNNLASAWAYTQWTTSYTAPTVHTPTATAGTDGTTGCPLIRIAAASGMTGSVTLLRSDGLYVRNASPSNPLVLAGGALAISDYEVVPKVAYTYTLQVVLNTGGVYTASAFVTSGSATVTTTGWWELDPNNPAGAFNAQLISWNPVVTEQSTAHLVTGQATPNIVASTMGGQDGQGTFETFDPVTYANVQSMLTSQTTYFVSSPWGATDSGYVRFGPQTGGSSGGNGNKVKDSTLLPSTYAGMHRTVAVTFVAQPRPPV